MTFDYLGKKRVLSKELDCFQIINADGNVCRFWLREAYDAYDVLSEIMEFCYPQPTVWTAICSRGGLTDHVRLFETRPEAESYKKAASAAGFGCDVWPSCFAK